MMGTPVSTPCLVQKVLSTLETSKIPGPDQLHPELLKWLADIFNNSLATVVVPGDWKAAVTCPIFKKGDTEDVVNYRPVSLTSVFCKIFERILKRAIMSFLSGCKAIRGCFCSTGRDFLIS